METRDRKILIKELTKIHKKVNRANAITFNVNEVSIEILSLLRLYNYHSVKYSTFNIELLSIDKCYQAIESDNLDDRLHVLIRNTSFITGNVFFLYDNLEGRFIFITPTDLSIYITSLLSTLKK